MLDTGLVSSWLCPTVDSDLFHFILKWFRLVPAREASARSGVSVTSLGNLRHRSSGCSRHHKYQSFLSNEYSPHVEQSMWQYSSSATGITLKLRGRDIRSVFLFLYIGLYIETTSDDRNRTDRPTDEQCNPTGSVQFCNVNLISCTRSATSYRLAGQSMGRSVTRDQNNVKYSLWTEWTRRSSVSIVSEWTKVSQANGSCWVPRSLRIRDTLPSLVPSLSSDMMTELWITIYTHFL